MVNGSIDTKERRNRGRVLVASWLGVLLLGMLLILAVPASAQESTQQPPVYVVQPGDTLYSIAERFGTTVDAIVAANKIDDPRLINVGQRLIIPTEQPDLVPQQAPVLDKRVHPVRPGDSLPALALRYGTTPWVLREVNDLWRLNLLLPGVDLVIPTPMVVLTGTPGFPLITSSPRSVVQGQTMAVRVGISGEADVNGHFLGQQLTFTRGHGDYWALVGVDSMTPPGLYPVTLSVTETETGDLLTVQENFSVTAGSFTRYNVVVPADRTNLLDPTLAQKEREIVNAAFAGISRGMWWDGTFSYPLQGDLRFTAPFGQRRSYNGGPVSSYHSGQDLGADEGVPVYAPAAGKVVVAEPLQVRGNVVIMDHGWGVFTGFWHLSQIDVTAGDIVDQGQRVGLVGDTGLSTGPHLHWEMRVGGVPVDPVQWIQQVFP